MKKLIGTVRVKGLAVLVCALRAAAVGLLYGGIHWLAWQHLTARHAWMVDAWLVSGAVLGFGFLAMHRLAPQYAERLGAMVALLVGALGLSFIPGEIARALPHLALLRSIDAVCKVLAVLLVAAGLWGMVLEHRARRAGRERGA